MDEFLHFRGLYEKLCWPVMMIWWMNEWNTFVRVSLSPESHSRKVLAEGTQETVYLLLLDMLSTRFFSVSSKRLYDIHATWFDCFSRRKGNRAALQ